MNKFIACLLLTPLAVSAHELDSTDKYTPILNIGGRYLDSRQDYPLARLPNALESAAQQAYQTGTALDYADIGLQVRWTDDLTTLVKGSYHGADQGNEFAFEQVWLKYNHDFADDSELILRLGRQNVALGRQNLEHSHNWQMGVTPLVMRAAVAGGWLDDGLDVSWQHADGWYAGAGAFKGDAFPGVKNPGADAATVRLGWRPGAADWQLSAARFQVDGRLSEQATQAGHSHSQNACLQPGPGQVCFNGDSDVLVLAASQPVGQTRLILSGEAWLKRESGALASLSGQVDYRGVITGGWLNAAYAFSPQWTGLVRWEGLQAEHRLSGANAALLAQEAVIADSDATLSRLGAGVVWQNDRGVRVTAEVHHETLATDDNWLVLVRYQLALWPLLQAVVH